MQKTEYIYAKKGKQTTKFTAYVWQNMGSHKNGWEVDTDKMQEVYGDNFKTEQPTTTKAAAPKVAKDVTDATKYKDLVAQGKGFEKDGKLADALGKYSQALTIKSTKALENKVAQLEKALGEQIELKVQENAIAAADEEFDNGNFEGAKELYLSVSNQELKHVKDRLAEIEGHLLG